MPRAPILHTIEIEKSGSRAVFELEQSGRTFKVLSAVVDGRSELSLGFDPASAEEVLDDSSDARQVFNIALRVRSLGCTLALDEMRAPDVETLRMALSKVKLRFWSQEEI